VGSTNVTSARTCDFADEESDRQLIIRQNPSSAAVARRSNTEFGTITALLGVDARIVSKGSSFMLDICDQCGSGVSKKLLHRSDATAVFHRECVNGHKLHRTTGQEDQRTADSYESKSYVIVEPCDCS
jgi:hypothetical protein